MRRERMLFYLSIISLCLVLYKVKFEEKNLLKDEKKEEMLWTVHLYLSTELFLFCKNKNI